MLESCIFYQFGNNVTDNISGDRGYLGWCNM